MPKNKKKFPKGRLHYIFMKTKQIVQKIFKEYKDGRKCKFSNEVLDQSSIYRVSIKFIYNKTFLVKKMLNINDFLFQYKTETA